MFYNGNRKKIRAETWLFPPIPGRAQIQSGGLVCLIIYICNKRRTKISFPRVTTHKNKMKLNYLCVNLTFSINYIHVHIKSPGYVNSVCFVSLIACSRPNLCVYSVHYKHPLNVNAKRTSVQNWRLPICSLIRFVIWPQFKMSEILFTRHTILQNNFQISFNIRNFSCNFTYMIHDSNSFFIFLTGIFCWTCCYDIRKHDSTHFTLSHYFWHVK